MKSCSFIKSTGTVQVLQIAAVEPSPEPHISFNYFTYVQLLESVEVLSNCLATLAISSL